MQKQWSHQISTTERLWPSNVLRFRYLFGKDTAFLWYFRPKRHANEKQKRSIRCLSSVPIELTVCITYPWVGSWVEAGEVASSEVLGDDSAVVEAGTLAVSSEVGAVALLYNLPIKKNFNYTLIMVQRNLLVVAGCSLWATPSVNVAKGLQLHRVGILPCPKIRPLPQLNRWKSYPCVLATTTPWVLLFWLDEGIGGNVNVF